TIAMSRRAILLPALLWFAGPTSPAATRAGESLPNVVFFFADDIGWADPGRYHEFYADGVNQPIPAPVPTPNMNRLCDEGMMFTDAQLPAALCAPNRFCVLTGSNTYRSRPWGTWNRTSSSAFHFGNAEDDRIGNPHRTIGDVLQTAGYRTAFFGKMHLGGDFYDSTGALLRDLPNEDINQIDFSRKFDNGMIDHGFDYTFVTPDGIQGPLYAYFENDTYRPVSDFAAEIDGVNVSGSSVLKSFTAGETVGTGEILVDGYGDSEFDTSEHGPVLTHFACKFIDDHLANHSGQPFMLYYASPAIHVPHTPSSDGIEADGATGLGKRPDFVYDLDAQLGILLAKLDSLGIAGNTIVVVTSDNGGFEDINGDGAGQAAAGQDPNGPLRASKGSIYEGGHRVPFIARWPGRIQAGSECDELVTLLDMTATLASLTGGTIPTGAAIDSCDVLPALLGRPHDKPGRDTFVAHVGGVAGRVPLAIRKGPWKLITEGGARPSFKDADRSNRTPLSAEDRKPFLVNLADDPGESKNVAAEDPERVLEMKTLLQKIVDQGRGPTDDP
ncbi:MAG: sulfatase-like hydrolase/transferase, partial [Verrucomicrobiae bacterium]|nr:sulfatase-like hydrolase/transferase [Verrucomicrobiae bacterium]